MVWTTEDGNELFFDLHEVVRFRVEGESWHDPEPKPPRAEDDEEEEPENKISPYMLTVSMADAVENGEIPGTNRQIPTGINATGWTWPYFMVGRSGSGRRG